MNLRIRQKGLGLVELMIGVAILGVLAGYAVTSGKQRISDAKTSMAIEGIVEAGETITLLYANNGSADYVGLTNQVAIDGFAFGPEFQSGGANLAVPGGGAILVQPDAVGGANQSFRLHISGLSRKACNRIANETSPYFRRVLVRPTNAGAFTTAKGDADTGADPIAVAASCVDAGDPSNNFDNEVRLIGGS